jgi:hypothetical protein
MQLEPSRVLQRASTPKTLANFFRENPLDGGRGQADMQEINTVETAGVGCVCLWHCHTDIHGLKTVLMRGNSC